MQSVAKIARSYKLSYKEKISNEGPLFGKMHEWQNIRV